jgi:hypothetical protein
MAATTQATTIALSHATKERLRKLAEKGETYEDVVLRLIDSAARRAMDERWNRILHDEAFTPLEDL